jgi:hypothetical protein
MTYRPNTVRRPGQVAAFISCLAIYGVAGCSGDSGDALPGDASIIKHDSAQKDVLPGAGGSGGTIGGLDSGGLGGNLGTPDALPGAGGSGGATTVSADSGVGKDAAGDTVRAVDSGGGDLPPALDLGGPDVFRDVGGLDSGGVPDVPVVSPDAPEVGWVRLDVSQPEAPPSDSRDGSSPNLPETHDTLPPADDTPALPEAGPEAGPEAPVDTRDANTGPSCSNPSWAKDFHLLDPGGLAADKEGNLFFANYLINSANFGGSVGQLTSAGDSDAIIVRFDPANGTPTWAKPFGDAQAQKANGVAVDKSGRVGFIGTYMGAMSVGTKNLSNLGSWPYAYVGALQSSDGAGLWALSANLAVDGASEVPFNVIAANPNVDDFVVCGSANIAATDLKSDLSAGGGFDIVVAKIRGSDGSVLWARQIGGTGDQRCTAAAVADSGDVFIAGNYAGQLDFGGGAFSPAPGATSRVPWIAKLKGSDGSTLQAVTATRPDTKKSTGYVYAIDTDGNGNVAIAGAFLTPLTFGSTSTLTSAGDFDAFVVKLDSSLTALWAARWGDANNAQQINGLAFDSSGNLTVIGSFQGTIDIRPSRANLTAAADTTSADSDIFLARLSGTDGTSGCALSYGDPLGQSGSHVVVPRAASGANKDVTFASGAFVEGSTLDFGSTSFTLPTANTEPWTWVARF